MLSLLRNNDNPLVHIIVTLAIYGQDVLIVSHLCITDILRYMHFAIFGSVFLAWSSCKALHNHILSSCKEMRFIANLLYYENHETITLPNLAERRLSLANSSHGFVA